MGHAAALPPRSAVAKVRANIVIHICSAIAWRGAPSPHCVQQLKVHRVVKKWHFNK
jgi:hypothetical protein